jgi:two-component SAPR family response regulator
VIDLHSDKARELIAFLACEHGLPVPKARIASQLWPSVPERRARDSLYKVLRHIRSISCAEVPIPVVCGQGRAYLDTSVATVDIEEFVRLSLGDDPAGWERAVAMCRCPLLCDEHFEWAAQYEGQYEMLCQDILERLAAYHGAVGASNKAYYYQHFASV